MGWFNMDILLAPLTSALVVFLPEIYLLLCAIFLVTSEVTYHREKTRLVFPVVVIGLFAAMAHTLWTFSIIGNGVIDFKHIIYNRYTVLFKLVILTGAVLHLL